jgi:hypothetical protein
MNKIANILNRFSRTKSLYLVFLLCFASVLFFWRIGTHVPGFSQTEFGYSTSNSSIANIVRNPINIIHKLAQHSLIIVGQGSDGALRSVSALYAMFGLFCFYYIIRCWHTRRVAGWSTLLLMSNSWFLASARLSNDDIATSCGVLIFLASFYYIIRTRKQYNLKALLLALIILLISLYSPIILVLATTMGMIYRKKLLKRLRLFKPSHRGIIYAITSVVVLPLILRLLSSKKFASSMFFGNDQISFSHFFDNFIKLIASPFYKNYFKADQYLGNLALLDIVTVLLVVLGAYFYLWQRPRAKRTWMLFGGGVLAIFVSSFAKQQPSVSLIVPFIFIGSAAGSTLLLHYWFSVFPRNPIARSTGVTIILSMISLASVYNLQRYYYAWRLAPETRANFYIVQSIPKK